MERRKRFIQNCDDENKEENEKYKLSINISYGS